MEGCVHRVSARSEEYVCQFSIPFSVVAAYDGNEYCPAWVLCELWCVEG